MTDKKFNFSKSMQELEEINKWFEREDIDLEEALEKLKQGKKLIQACKAKLNEIENEFVEIKEDLEEEETSTVVEVAKITLEQTSSDGELPF